MKTITTTFILSFLFINFSFAQVLKDYHENGELKSIINYTNGNGDGEVKLFNENGKLESISKVADDKLNGETKYYYETGELESIENFIDGKENGAFKNYHENGQLKEISNWVDGKVNGEWKSYHENGSLYQFGEYLNSFKTGEWKYFMDSEDSTYYFIAKYIEGVKVTMKSYEESLLSQMVEFKDEEKNMQTDYYETGQISKVSKFVDGSDYTLEKRYHKNGQLESTGQIKGWQEVGKWIWYDENGKIVKEQLFEE